MRARGGVRFDPERVRIMKIIHRSSLMMSVTCLLGAVGAVACGGGSDAPASEAGAPGTTPSKPGGGSAKTDPGEPGEGSAKTDPSKSGVGKVCQKVTAVATDDPGTTVARPAARLLLSDELLGRLRERAEAGDAAWTALAETCDDYAGGTVHAPSGEKYPGYPNVGQGYQGDEYYTPMLSLALCYRVTESTDPASAKRYAEAGKRVLSAIATPASEGGQPPSTNVGYGIRFYGVSMALGFDWLYPELDAALRQRVVNTLNEWVDWYDQQGMSRNHPVGNYFAGYFAAKTYAAIATEGDNPKAAEYWEDARTRLWGELVHPRYAEWMAGGGWPEGWGYGARATRTIAEVLFAVKTAKGLDWPSELPYAADQARYVTAFAWPSLERMDDQGTVRTSHPLTPSVSLTSTLATILEQTGDPSAAAARAFSKDVIAAAGDDRAPFEQFLFDDPKATMGSYTDLPLSYFAAGPSHVAMRSSWEKSAVWAAFSGGAYINSPDSGEQMFNSGNLSVNYGGYPVIVNASGWLPHAAGVDGENFVYADSHGPTSGRRLQNTFYAEDPNSKHSPGQNGANPDQSATHVDRYEDRAQFVRARSVAIEDQYGAADTRNVVEFSRDVVYVRPGSFVVFDSTALQNPASDHFLAFHTTVAPQNVATSDPAQRRFDVVAEGQNVGSVRTHLPSAAQVDAVALPGGVNRLEVRPTDAAERRDWLTVISAGEAAAEQDRLSAEDGNVTGDAVGVHLHGERDQVVLFAKGSTDALSTIEYDVAPSADADHILVGFAPSDAGYDIQATATDSGVTVRVTPGGDFQVSSGGTLSFELTQDGRVTAPEVDEELVVDPAEDPDVGGRGVSGPSGKGSGSNGCAD